MSDKRHMNGFRGYVKSTDFLIYIYHQIAQTPFQKLSMRYFFIVAFLSFFACTVASQDPRRWDMEPDGSISWHIKGDIPHDDHIEMSGKRISCVLRYGVAADGSFHATRSLVWPMLRTVPNNTHASLIRRFGQDGFDMVMVNYKPIPPEVVSQISINGTLLVKSMAGKDLALTRQYFPSTTLPGYIEMYTIRNSSQKNCVVEIPTSGNTYFTDPAMGTEGRYALHVDVINQGSFTLKPNDAVSFSIFYSGFNANEQGTPVDIENELAARMAFVHQMWNKLVLETPDTVLNRAFAFAKIRASESIFQTKGGAMHGPGGEAYYAAIWANDQGEYVGPFFPFLGYDYANKASLNAYMLFSKFINAEFNPIPSSIIAEGTDIWNGAGDRGDAAMIAYGAARFALADGDKEQAEKLWPLIEWCLEYCHRHLNTDGVVTSDTDELEGRFPAGTANLCTSSLYYDALISAAYLGEALDKKNKQINTYQGQAKTLGNAIERYFGATISGYETYKYYKENDVLRAWICIPLTMGIYDRKAGTIAALFSKSLWTEDGLASLAGDSTFWDRSTLYALRGVFASGETEQALRFLHAYSNRRLLGDHVPYPVEAYPEGNQRQLSAESGLYCRIFTEGLFGIRPTGFNSFTFTPHLPAAWPSMSLRHILAFNHNFDITVERKDDKLNVTVSRLGEIVLNKLIKEGDEVKVEF